MFGANLPKVFKKLIEALPDEKLRQALLQAHNDFRLRQKSGASGRTKSEKKEESWPSLGGSNPSSNPTLSSQWMAKPGKEKPPPATKSAPQSTPAPCPPGAVPSAGDFPALGAPGPAPAPVRPKGRNGVTSMDDFPALGSAGPARPMLVGSWARRK